jgi:hypothetical protein
VAEAVAERKFELVIAPFCGERITSRRCGDAFDAVDIVFAAEAQAFVSSRLPESSATVATLR